MRLYRTVSQETKDKISASKQGQKHTEATKQKISASLTKYWKTIPPAPENNFDNSNVKCTK